MSTYLVAMVVGKLTCQEDTYKGNNDVKVKVCARLTAAAELDLAKESAMKQIKILEDYYQVPYPLEKLGDLIISYLFLNEINI